MKLKLRKSGITRVLVLPDLHFPVEDRRSLAAVEGLMKDEEWDHLIYLGDVMDFNCVSDHNKHNLRAVTGQTVGGDYEYANKVLARHSSLVGPECSMTWLEGNHDQRIERVIDANPVMQGQLEVKNNISLIQDGTIKYVPYWFKGETVQVGKATFIHGLYVNEYHAKTHALNFGTNIFYGHTHDTMNYPKVWAGQETIIAQSLGCLCQLNQRYVKGKPTKWIQAFGGFYFQPGGYFTYYVPMIFNHKFVWKGKVYKG